MTRSYRIDSPGDPASDALQSEVISFLRFPLIVGVVMSHTILENVRFNGIMISAENSLPLFHLIYNLFSNIIGRLGVPLFYIFSSYLFFKGSFTTDNYLGKLKRRAKTILLPYILWNLLVIITYLLQQSLLPQLSSGRSQPLSERSLLGFFALFWDYENSMPICYQLWFMRDLMVLMILSPVIYFVIKKIGIFAVIITGLMWISDTGPHYPGVGLRPLFFFTFGAYFRIKGRNFVAALLPLRDIALLLFIILCCFDLNELQDAPGNKGSLHCICILSGVIALVGITATFIRNGSWKTNRFLSESTFFIYAYHALLLSLLLKLTIKIFLPDTEIAMLSIYFLVPTFVIILGLGLYYLLERFTPRIAALLTGGRVSITPKNSHKTPV